MLKKNNDVSYFIEIQTVIFVGTCNFSHQRKSVLTQLLL